MSLNSPELPFPEGGYEYSPERVRQAARELIEKTAAWIDMAYGASSVVVDIVDGRFDLPGYEPPEIDDTTPYEIIDASMLQISGDGLTTPYVVTDTLRLLNGDVYDILLILDKSVGEFSPEAEQRTVLYFESKEVNVDMTTVVSVKGDGTMILDISPRPEGYDAHVYTPVEAAAAQGIVLEVLDAIMPPRSSAAA